MADEYLDLVNEKDEIIGRKKRSEIYARNLHNFRVVNAFIKNSKGQIWIPRRTANKELFPLCLDVSVGGHVASGEMYKEAFNRESLEELNIDISKEEYILLGSLTPRDGVSAFMRVWEIRTDNTPDYNKNDFSEFYWISPEELMRRIDNGEKTKEDLPKLVRIFYKN